MKNILRQRHNQALVKFDGEEVRYEWWYNVKKMQDGIKLEEKGGKTLIHCLTFHGYYREIWLLEEFDRRVPKENNIRVLDPWIAEPSAEESNQQAV